METPPSRAQRIITRDPMSNKAKLAARLRLHPGSIADAGGREGCGHIPHLRRDALQRLLVVYVVDRFREPGGDLTHLRLAHAAGGDGRRADAYAAGAERLARVVGDSVVVDDDAGAVEGLGRLLGDDALAR